ncbi:MAG: hypothetical protein FJ218_08470 [Ignavibacteria bacterium]|nr:hypothetical protein [Ignavibacteria bacterium]
MIRVLLVSKENCSLCDEAKVLLKNIQKNISFEYVETILNESHPKFFEYQFAVPLVFIGDEEVCRFKADENIIKYKLLQLVKK